MLQLFFLTTLAANPISTCSASSHAGTYKYGNRAPISAFECGNRAKAGGNRSSTRSAGEGVNVAPAKKSDAVSNGLPQRRKR